MALTLLNGGMNEKRTTLNPSGHFEAIYSENVLSLSNSVNVVFEYECSNLILGNYFLHCLKRLGLLTSQEYRLKEFSPILLDWFNERKIEFLFYPSDNSLFFKQADKNFLNLLKQFVTDSYLKRDYV